MMYKCGLFCGISLALVGYLCYYFVRPHYHIGDANRYYIKHQDTISNITGDRQQNSIETEDNIRLYIEQCTTFEADVQRNQKRRAIVPILFINGGPGFPPEKCPLFLSELAAYLNNNQNQKYYISYIYHQRGSGNSSRLFDTNVSFTRWTDKVNAFETLHQRMGIHQHIVDIERIRHFIRNTWIDFHPQNHAFKISLIGHSFGCIFASLYAAEFGMNVDTMALIAGAPLLDFNVFYSKYNIFEMVQQYIPEALADEYNAFVSKFTDFNRLMESNEEEINSVYLGFGQYYMMANKEHIRQKYPNYDAGRCAPNAKHDTDGVGGWMIISVYYDMGMLHFWNNKVHQNVCLHSPNVMVLHLEYDLQSAAASFEYVKTFQCKKNIVLNGTVSQSDHLMVYAEKAECVSDLIQKIAAMY